MIPYPIHLAARQVRGARTERLLWTGPLRDISAHLQQGGKPDAGISAAATLCHTTLLSVLLQAFLNALQSAIILLIPLILP